MDGGMRDKRKKSCMDGMRLTDEWMDSFCNWRLGRMDG